jgi:hypothetical protein
MLPFGTSGAIWSTSSSLKRALKLIVVRSDIRGYASELAKTLRDKDNHIDRKPLGSLVQDFFKTVYSNHSTNDSPANELDEVWMSISLRIQSNKNLIRHRRRQLRELVKERNLLVHRLLANPDPNSVESCEKLICLLDEQVDGLEPTSLSWASLETCRQRRKRLSSWMPNWAKVRWKTEMPFNLATENALSNRYPTTASPNCCSYFSLHITGGIK